MRDEPLTEAEFATDSSHLSAAGGVTARVGAALSVVDRVIALSVDVVLAVALVSDLVIVVAGVVARYFFDHSIPWVEEASQFTLILLAFLGGANAFARNLFPTVNFATRRLPRGLQDAQAAFVNWTVLATAIAACWTLVPLLEQQWASKTVALQISAGWFVLPIIVGCALIALNAIARLLRIGLIVAVSIGAVFAVVVATFVYSRALWEPRLGDMGMLSLVLVIAALLLLTGVPIAFVLTASAMIYLFIPGDIALVAYANNLRYSVDNFLLLSIPFFILAGILMDVAGVSTRMVAFVGTLVGHMRGGLLQVMVVTMYLFSGISGSETADVSAVGSAMSKTMRARGYSEPELAAVLSSSAAMGITVPPSIAALVLASVSSISVGALFAAGLVPAALLALVLMITIAWRARRVAMPTDDRASAGQVGAAFVKCIPAFGMVVILLGGILSGVATPTEVSSLGVVYGLFLAIVVYRSASAKTLWEAMVSTANLVGMVLFLVAAASAFAWVLTINRVPQRVAEAAVEVPGGTWVFLPITIVVVMALGALFEGIPALLTLAPILIPTAVGLGIDPVHYGIVLIFAMGIGSFSPPIGIGFLVASSVAGSELEPAMRRYVPYFAALCIGLLVIAFVPWFTVVLPGLIGL